jgi:acyl-CoA synthetase (AMP-forming)/AMP-acid ligase II
MSRFRATNTGAPNFAYALCVEKITADEMEGLDLSRWRVAYCGAEFINAATLRAFHEKFESCGFRWSTFFPSYGLAEAVCLVSTNRMNEPAEIRAFDRDQLSRGHAVPVPSENPLARSLVASGRPCCETRVRIVDPVTCDEKPDRSIGEIWVQGPCVAPGYWDAPASAGDAFDPENCIDGEGPFLRTGDLGFLDDGHLFVSGRLKELIIIRGRNLHPAEIEAFVQEDDDRLVGNAGAAFSLPVDGDESLVIVQEVQRHVDPSAYADVIDDIRERVIASVDIQPDRIALVRVASVPKTSSGKIIRSTCRDAYLAGRLHVLAEA